MFSSPIIINALRTAYALHAGQMRKHDGATPFIVHPLGVAFFLTRFTDDHNIIAAALLHDTIEDTSYTKNELYRDFGHTIGNLVISVTEPPRATHSWEERKAWYLENLIKTSTAARMISCADKVNNLNGIRVGYEEQGKDVFEKFNPKSMWFYEEVYKILCKDETLRPLLKRYKELLQQVQGFLNEKS